jgi:hypothetical protein
MEKTPHTLPFDYCHRWIRAAFFMAERYFTFFVVLGLIVFSTEMLVSIIPYIGSIANPVLRFTYTLGTLQMMDQLFHNNSKTNSFTYESFLRLCFDENTLKRFKNHLIACAAAGFVTEMGIYLRIPHFYLVTLLSTVGLSLIPFMAYFSLRNPQSSAESSMRWVLAQTWKNIGNLLIHAVFLIALATVSLALCVVPFFLYFLPLTFPLVYLVYMGLCEGKTIEELSLKWNSAGDSLAGG